MNVEYRSIIVATLCSFLVPFLQLYSLYVIMHGHSSPGGGFQGGVIMGASFILLVISMGREQTLRRMTPRVNDLMGSMGVLIYAGIGLACVILGANFLDYSVLPIPGTTVARARYLGMLGIEIGVGISVMAIMVSIFLNLLSPDTSSEENDGISG